MHITQVAPLVSPGQYCRPASWSHCARACYAKLQKSRQYNWGQVRLLWDVVVNPCVLYVLVMTSISAESCPTGCRQERCILWHTCSSAAVPPGPVTSLVQLRTALSRNASDSARSTALQAKAILAELLGSRGPARCKCALGEKRMPAVHCITIRLNPARVALLLSKTAANCAQNSANNGASVKVGRTRTTTGCDTNVNVVLR